jgi:hypothetical protein
MHAVRTRKGDVVTMIATGAIGIVEEVLAQGGIHWCRVVTVSGSGLDDGGSVVEHLLDEGEWFTNNALQPLLSDAPELHPAHALHDYREQPVQPHLWDQPWEC